MRPRPSERYPSAHTTRSKSSEPPETRWSVVPCGVASTVQTIRNAPPQRLLQMSPVEQHGAHLDVAQPSLPAGPGCTGDEPGVPGPAGGNGPVEEASRRHVLPRGGNHEDPG